MAKKIAVLMTDLVEDIEYTSPVNALESQGHDVEVIAPEAGEVEGKKGGKFKADKSISEVKPDDYDAVYVPGGFSPDGLRGDEDDRFSKFAKHFIEQDKPTFAICHGPQLLVDTDLLSGRNLTAVKNVRKDLENAGAKVHDQEVTVCSNLVTSRTPDDLDAFNGEIMKQLA